MQVHYRVEGEGMPIVLIHGTGSCLQTWDTWTDTLQKNNFKVIRLDMPGFGLTGARKDKDYSVKTYINFLDTFLQRIHIDTFAIAGNSLGGEIAWRYALEHPSKVSTLFPYTTLFRSTEERRVGKECTPFFGRKRQEAP